MLNPDKIPVKLRFLIPFAEKWGIGDDVERDMLLEDASPEERIELIEAMRGLEAEFDDWLGGAESKFGQWSDEYIAFSCLRQAADYAQAIENESQKSH